MPPRTTGTARCPARGNGRTIWQRPRRRYSWRTGVGEMLSWLVGNPPDAGVLHPLPAPPMSSVPIVRASAFKASLEPVTPPLRNLRRDTGFPAAASLRAIMRA